MDFEQSGHGLPLGFTLETGGGCCCGGCCWIFTSCFDPKIHFNISIIEIMAIMIITIIPTQQAAPNSPGSACALICG